MKESLKRLLNATLPLVASGWMLTAASVALTSCSDEDVFTPYRATDLRLPAVPIVVNDPYFSIWSTTDRLNEGATKLWTDAAKPIDGMLRVDGRLYRFMGGESPILAALAPMADAEAWGARMLRFTVDKTGMPQGTAWTAPDYDDGAWEENRAPFGDRDNCNTRWGGDNGDLFVRRTVELSADDLEGDIWFEYSHDDTFEAYINGTQIVGTDYSWRDNVRLKLSAEQKALLKTGRNVIATHTHNKTGGAYTDFALYRDASRGMEGLEQAEQTSVDVTATSSYYAFACGPVELKVVFTAPMLIDDYDLLSMPINYVSYRVNSLDDKKHDVQLLLATSPLLAVNKNGQATRSEVVVHNGTQYVKAGTVNQPVLARTGDVVAIDWGYAYLSGHNGTVALTSPAQLYETFSTEGKLPESETVVTAKGAADMPAMAYLHDFGTTGAGESFAMIGYDEVWDIEYMYERYKAYWAHGGKVTIFDAFNRMATSYSSIMKRCRALDKLIYDDGEKAGGKEYAEMLSASYRHVMAAHKLFEDKEGNLLFFSKENNSNGCVNTVDLTYPEAPLFLCYNVELQKAQMTSILDYSRSGRWTKPFAAHDLGQYPRANGQVYGGDMPLEEAGNMLTLLAEIAKIEGNTGYAEKYWDILKVWADYLAENGADPENQLCTDDFAGHWAHNANLSVKAILGVTAYAEMAKMRGMDDEAAAYMNKAKEMAQSWEERALEGDHYKLAFDRDSTWSQKYNLIWDRLWETGIFSKDVYEKEISYYLTKQNTYGLPLDCRKDYTKSDWIMWTAGMSPDVETFREFMLPVYKYINETPSRVPISDWSDTKTGQWVSFRARSVIGGYWMKVLADKHRKK